MKEIVVISGKGGTGKTSLVSAFAYLAGNKVLCDADVDAADLHLVLDPTVRERHDFVSGHTAKIDPDSCTGCGLCRELCRFDAISEDFVIDGLSCEGCGVCWYMCPEKAVDFPENTCGEWFISDTRFGPLVHARLGIAEENSGKLVTLVRKTAKQLAQSRGHELILTDGPPGVGCPVIASIGGADGVLIVTEPSLSGKHDAERVADLAHHFGVPAMVCVNKFDLNPQTGEAIERFARDKGAEVLGRIPFDPALVRSMVQAQTLYEYDGNTPAGQAIEAIWEKLTRRLG